MVADSDMAENFTDWPVTTIYARPSAADTVYCPADILPAVVDGGQVLRERTAPAGNHDAHDGEQTLRGAPQLHGRDAGTAT